MLAGGPYEAAVLLEFYMNYFWWRSSTLVADGCFLYSQLNYVCKSFQSYVALGRSRAFSGILQEVCVVYHVSVHSHIHEAPVRQAIYFSG